MIPKQVSIMPRNGCPSSSETGVHHRPKYPTSHAAEGLFLHPNMGEVYSRGEVDAGGFVPVMVPRKQTAVKVMRSTLVDAHDRDAFEEAMRARVTAYRRMAEPFAALALRHYLSHNDPVSAMIGNGLILPNQSTLSHHYWCKFLGNIRYHGIESQQCQSLANAMRQAAIMLGFDAIAWGWLLCNGVSPDDLLIRRADKKTSAMMAGLRSQITTDLVRGMHQYRTWQDAWREMDAPAVPNLAAAGFYYPTYYAGEKPDDMTQLTYDFVAGTEGILQDVAGKMGPLADEWVAHMRRAGKDVMLVPMIGTARTDELVKLFGYPSVFPWQARPANYGQGVEGLTLYQKMDVLAQAMRLDPRISDNLRGKALLIIDDNITDKATYMQARRLLFDAGADSVGIAALSETIRNPNEITLSIR